jgi:ribonuclease-3
MSSDSQAPAAEEAAPPDGLERLCDRLELDTTLSHLAEALTHPSFANEHDHIAADNQRLEFLGDAVLGVCVSELLMAAFTEVDEGELTVMRASLVNASALAEAAQRVELGEALRLGRGADAAGERLRSNVLADALEALVGAVYLDCGLARARTLSHALLREPLERLLKDGGMQRDPKSRLQELIQARGMDPPRYDVTGIEGPPHQRRFTARVVLPDLAHPAGEPLSAEGSGRSKKRAEQAAAHAALAKLENDAG